MDKKYLLLIIVFIVIFLVAGGYLIVRYSIQKNHQREYIERNLRLMRCTSLCPTYVKTDEYNGSARRFDENCIIYCSHEKDVGPVKLTGNYKELFDGFSEDIIFCLYDMERMVSEDYASCYNTVFDRYKSILDLANYTLGSYQIYNFSFDNLECTDEAAVITVTLHSGETNAGMLIISFISNDILAPLSDSLVIHDVPSVGDQRSYLMPYAQYGNDKNGTYTVVFGVDGGGGLAPLRREC